jgi:hypothetical protein
MEEMAVIVNKKLKKCIGKKIHIEYVYNGVAMQADKTLLGIDDYEHISVDGIMGHENIAFVGVWGQAIKSISCEGEVVYFNPYISTDYKGDSISREKIAYKMFGECRVKAERDLHLRFFPDPKQDYKVGEEYIVYERGYEIIDYYGNHLNEYIIKGDLYIDDAQGKKDWSKYCKKAKGNFDRIIVVTITIQLLRALYHGLSCKEAVTVVASNFNPSWETLHEVIKLTGSLSSRGKELLEFWTGYIKKQGDKAYTPESGDQQR